MTIDAPIAASPSASRLNPFGAMLAQFFGFSIPAGLWAGSVPFVTGRAGMSTADIGTAFTLYTATYILAMSFGGKLLSHTSPRRILLVANPANLAALTGLLLAPSPILVAIFLASIGVTMGLTDLVMNAEGTLVEADMQRPILARLHGSASTGTGIGALAGSVFALTIGPWASIALAAIFLTIAFAAVVLATPDRPAIHRSHGGVWAAYSTALLVLGVIFGIEVAGETAASIWSARLLAEQAPQLAVIAGIGVSFFCGCQAVMRFMGDRLRRALGDVRLIVVTLVIAAIGFAVVGFSADFTMSVSGFALVGIGTAMQAPCLFALASRIRPQNAGAALSLVATIGGAPRLIAPWCFGAIASRWSTGAAFGTIAAAFLIAIGLAIVIQKQRPPAAA